MQGATSGGEATTNVQKVHAYIKDHPGTSGAKACEILGIKKNGYYTANSRIKVKGKRTLKAKKSLKTIPGGAMAAAGTKKKVGAKKKRAPWGGNRTIAAPAPMVGANFQNQFKRLLKTTFDNFIEAL